MLRTALACLLVTLALARADVALPPIFGDHMVLQRDVPLPVWGTASPGEEVSVSLAGQEPKKATAAADGTWRVTLDPIASMPQPTALAVSGKNVLVFSDVLIGDVWLCSGQSNMRFPLKDTTNAAEAIAAANLPQLRIFLVPPVLGAFEPRTTLPGQWVVCSPESVPDTFAVAYYFGRDLLAATGQPVGLIQSAVGGTPIQAWTSEFALRTLPEFVRLADSTRATQAKFPALKQEWDTKILPDWQQKQKAWDEASAQFAAWESAAVAAKAAGQPAPSKPAPVGTPPVQPRFAGENKTMAFCLFNAMIHPLIPYAIKGAIWYQGESNAKSLQSADEYSRLFPLMIFDWRSRWERGDFPFIFVQLPGLGDRKDTWPPLRQAQLQALSVPNTAMVVSIDVGNKGDLHPKNKLPIGQRLALAARKLAYGQDIEASGPLYDTFDIEGSKIRVTFKHARDGLVAGPSTAPAKTVKGFTIAGEDGKFVPAQATLAGSTVVVWDDSVPAPRAVRYAWQDFPDANLFNRAALPASPFATDFSFPLPAAAKPTTAPAGDADP